MKEKLIRIIQKSGRWYIAYVKETPGVNTQGRTRKSARCNLKEALRLILEERAHFSRYSCRNSTAA
jgi:predicted RNase H-like HicB family nuclease